jgi:hypothetical protein
MHLHKIQDLASTGVSKNQPSSALSTRCWYALVMLDAWNALSTSTPTMIPTDSVVIQSQCREWLGDDTYFLLRECPY